MTAAFVVYVVVMGVLLHRLMEDFTTGEALLAALLWPVVAPVAVVVNRIEKKRAARGGKS
jgi:hypothetical protein